MSLSENRFKYSEASLISMAGGIAGYPPLGNRIVTEDITKRIITWDDTYFVQSAIPTKDINLAVKAIQYRVVVLEDAVINLWKNHNYNDLYTDYQQEHISKEEFIKHAEILAIESKPYTSQEVKQRLSIFCSLLGVDILDSEQLGLLTGADPHQLELALDS